MILPTHSRTSSSASSVGSSYVSSTDSNKTSHIESPTPSLQSHALDIVQNSDFHVNNNGTTTSSVASSSSSSSLPPYQSLCKLINEPIYNQNGLKHHHHNHHPNNNNHSEHDVASDTDNIDYADLHHETTKFNNNINDKLKQTNGNADDAHHLPSDDPIVGNGGEQFAYKTLNGDVIRSVVPPGKGKSINYKVSDRFIIAVHIGVKWPRKKNTVYDNAWTSVNNFHALFFSFVFSLSWN